MPHYLLIEPFAAICIVIAFSLLFFAFGWWVGRDKGYDAGYTDGSGRMFEEEEQRWTGK